MLIVFVSALPALSIAFMIMLWGPVLSDFVFETLVQNEHKALNVPLLSEYEINAGSVDAILKGMLFDEYVVFTGEIIVRDGFIVSIVMLFILDFISAAESEMLKKNCIA